MDLNNLPTKEFVFKDAVLSPHAPRLSAHNQRCKSLAEVDSALVGISHLRVVLVAGTGFFTDAHGLFSANFITALIGLIYFPGHKIPISGDTAIKLSTTAGAVIWPRLL